GRVADHRRRRAPAGGESGSRGDAGGVEERARRAAVDATFAGPGGLATSGRPSHTRAIRSLRSGRRMGRRRRSAAQRKTGRVISPPGAPDPPVSRLLAAVSGSASSEILVLSTGSSPGGEALDRLLAEWASKPRARVLVLGTAGTHRDAHATRLRAL